MPTLSTIVPSDYSPVTVCLKRFPKSIKLLIALWKTRVKVAGWASPSDSVFTRPSLWLTEAKLKPRETYYLQHFPKRLVLMQRSADSFALNKPSGLPSLTGNQQWHFFFFFVWFYSAFWDWCRHPSICKAFSAIRLVSQPSASFQRCNNPFSLQPCHFLP